MGFTCLIEGHLIRPSFVVWVFKLQRVIFPVAHHTYIILVSAFHLSFSAARTRHEDFIVFRHFSNPPLSSIDNISLLLSA